MNTYEYRILSFTTSDPDFSTESLQAAFNTVGRDGWLLCTGDRPYKGNPNFMIFTFSRVVTQEQEPRSQKGVPVF